MKLECQGREEGLWAGTALHQSPLEGKGEHSVCGTSLWMLLSPKESTRALWGSLALCFTHLGFAVGCMFCVHVPWHGSRSQPCPGEEGELGCVRTSLVYQSLSREGRQELP